MIICKLDLESLTNAGIEAKEAIEKLATIGVKNLELDNFDPEKPAHVAYVRQNKINIFALNVVSTQVEAVLNDYPGVAILLDFAKEDFDPFFLTDQQNISFLVGEIAQKNPQTLFLFRLNVDHFTIVNNVRPLKIHLQNLTSENLRFQTSLNSLVEAGLDPLGFATNLGSRLAALELDGFVREYIDEQAVPIRKDFADMEIPGALLETVSHALSGPKLVFSATKTLISHDFDKFQKNFKKISDL